ncbi:organic cation transporter protein-like isoform X2 [Cylas formicarius]|nr:organic cation transporter protein-like isoform X2 [Cylas formicarius]XP_060516081.1 organic cation transporter protein-like isoform X2 [Cylas formicarius]
MDNEAALDIDGMLAHVGDFSRYQLMLMFLFSIINILSAFHYFGQTFTSLVPLHKCNATGVANSSIADPCSIRIFDNSSYVDVPCTTGWIYDDSNTNGYISIVQELNWVCGESWKSALGQSVFFVGSVVGGIVLGILADNIGRLHTLVLANMFALLGNAVTILSNNVVLFAVSRFFAGCATDTNFVMMYIIVMEYIRPSMRTLGLNICIGLFYTLSCVAIPWVVALVGTWRIFLLIVSIPHLLVLLFYVLVPESAQWLISKGRIDEAVECFRRIAKINRRTVSPKTVDALKRYCEEHIPKKTEKHENLIGLVKTPNLRRKTLILVYKSMVMTLCYDAISKNVNGVGLSPFVIFSVTSATILPACLFILGVQDRVGRKVLASGSLLLSGIFSGCSGLLRIFVQNPQPELILVLAIIARLGINVAYNSGHQYAIELLPTVVRGQGVAAVHVAGYGATFFSTQILYLGVFWKPTPELILGIVMISGAIACLYLPETLNRKLPVTLQDGEAFGEDEGPFEFTICGSRNTESTIALNRGSDGQRTYS